MPPTVAPARALRGAVVAVVGLGVAASAHAQAGGGVAATPLLALVTALVVAASALASHRQWTLVRLLVALTGMQVVAHLTLWFEGGAHVADPRLALVATPAAAHAHGSSAGGPSPGMLAVHAVAVIVTALLLAGLDAAVVVLRALARRLVGAVVVRRPASPPRLPVGSHRPLRALVLERGPVVRRGPPASLAPC